MIINHNIAALNTYRQLSINTQNTSKSLEKLSSGQRINKAGDDAAGLAISEKMRAQIRGLDQASRNAQDGISLVQTAEGALSETQDILQRMRELAVQGSTDTNVTIDRSAIQQEMNSLTSEINRIGNTTQFNTQNLLNGDKANTFKVTGTTFASGATTKAVLSGAASLVNGVLNSGSYSLEITTSVSSGTRVIQAGLNNNGATLNATVADVVYASGFGTKPTFVGGKIHLTSGAGGSGPLLNGTNSGDLVIRNSGGTLVVSGVNASGGVSFQDSVTQNASGMYVYNNHGVSFSISSISGWASGKALSYHKDGGAAVADLGTGQKLWDTVSIQGSGTSASANAMFSGGGITIASGQNGKIFSGTYTIHFVNTAGGSGGTITVKGNGPSGLFSGTFTVASGNSMYAFDAYGIKFGVKMSGLGSGGSGTLTFDVKDQITHNVYQTTYKATLKNASGVAMASGTIGKSAFASGSGAKNGIGQKLSGTVSGLSIGAGLNLSFASGTVMSGSTTDFTVYRKTSGTDKSLTFQIGANQSQSMSLDINDMRAAALGISSTHAGSGYATSLDVTNGTNNTNVEYSLDVSNSANASNAITVINNAINKVSAERAKLGASQNRLEHTINNLGTSSQNLQSAESRIRDVDMASEMMNFTKNNILSQAAQSMLAQANQLPQGVLQLLR